MNRFSPWAVAALILLPAIPLVSQIRPLPPQSVPRPRAARQIPCWQEAGISKAALEERRQIQQSTRASVQSVCNDSALNMQQKREKIRLIREQNRARMEGLITPQQEQALKACQEQRRGARPPGMGGGGMHHGEGPCGEMPGKQNLAPGEEPE